jgi:hypothetical protein
VQHKFESNKVENSKLDRTYVAVAELITLLTLKVVSLKATFVLKQRKVKNDFRNFDQILVRFYTFAFRPNFVFMSFQKTSFELKSC